MWEPQAKNPVELCWPDNTIHPYPELKLYQVILLAPPCLILQTWPLTKIQPFHMNFEAPSTCICPQADPQEGQPYSQQSWGPCCTSKQHTIGLRLSRSSEPTVYWGTLTSQRTGKPKVRGLGRDRWLSREMGKRDGHKGRPVGCLTAQGTLTHRKDVMSCLSLGALSLLEGKEGLKSTGSPLGSNSPSESEVSKSYSNPYPLGPTLHTQGLPQTVRQQLLHGSRSLTPHHGEARQSQPGVRLGPSTPYAPRPTVPHHRVTSPATQVWGKGGSQSSETLRPATAGPGKASRWKSRDTWAASTEPHRALQWAWDSKSLASCLKLCF